MTFLSVFSNALTKSISFGAHKQQFMTNSLSNFFYSRAERFSKFSILSGNIKLGNDVKRALLKEFILYDRYN